MFGTGLGLKDKSCREIGRRYIEIHTHRNMLEFWGSLVDMKYRTGRFQDSMLCKWHL